MNLRRALLPSLIALTLTSPAHALTARPGPAAGTIVTAQGDEQLRLVTGGDWLTAEVQQELLGGDTLRTGPYGGLALLFTDRTQVRVQRNSVLTVKEVSGKAPSVLGLDQGGLWSRSATGGRGVRIETPSATAAIRGTEWSLGVGEGGRSTVVVIDGEVLFSNPFGSITVGPGEMGTAEVGKPPQKNILVRPELRAQFAMHVEPQYGLWSLPLTPGRYGARRQALEALLAQEEKGRTPAEWGALAELAVDLGRYREAQSALERLPVDSPQRHYVGGYLQALHGQWREAERMLATALPRLDGHRRATAAVAHYMALVAQGRFAEAEKARAALGKEGVSLQQQLARAWLLAYQGDLPAAEALLLKLAQEHPEEADVAAMGSGIALLLGHEEPSDRLSRRAIEIDPDSPQAWAARGNYLNSLTSSTLESIAAQRKALELAPENWVTWNNLGHALAKNGQQMSAEKAYRRAIELAPFDPIPPMNLAILLLNELRLPEARELLARFEDQGGYNQMVLGRLAMQEGRLEDGLNHFLSASAAEPLLAGAEIGTAASYFELGEVKRANQAVENADRLDPNDPLAPLVASIIAQDSYEADAAVEHAREALRRIQASETTEFSEIASSRDGAISVGGAMNLLGLSDWGKFYNDLAFSPFDANSNFVRAFGSDSALAYLTTGYTLDPLANYSRNRHLDIYYRPFTDLSFRTSYNETEPTGFHGFTHTLQVRGYRNEPRPYAYVFNLERSDATETDWEQEAEKGSLHLGSRLTANTGMFIQAGFDNDGYDWTPAGFEQSRRSRFSTLLLGFGHYLGDRDVVMGAFSLARNRTELDYTEGDTLSEQDDEARTPSVAVRRLFQIDRTTISVGADWTEGEIDSDRRNTVAGSQSGSASSGKLTTTRGDINVLWQPTRRFDLEAGLSLVQTNFPETETNLGPRVGVAWKPDATQMLRVAARRDPAAAILQSMTPPDTVGLAPSMQEIGAQVDTYSARWDKEWHRRLFTAVTAEHIDYEEFGQEGRIDHAGVAANLWLGGGVGLTAFHRRSDGEITGGALAEPGPLPLLAEEQSAIGLNWVHPSTLTARLTHFWVGERKGSDRSDLDPYESTTLSMLYSPWDRHLGLGFTVYNLFDHRYETDTGSLSTGRQWSLSGSVHF